MPTPEHNPQSIPPSEIPPGERLCRESEREKLPIDARFWDPILSFWYGTAFKRICPAEDWAWFTYITATPLPESEREVPAASPWIPLSERRPHESDFPIYLGKADTKQVWFWATKDEMVSREPLHELATHWTPGPKLPAPPPAPAKTQREKDEDAYHKLEGSFMNTHGSYVVPRTAFFHALETERAHFGGRSSEEVKEAIKGIVDSHACLRDGNVVEPQRMSLSVVAFDALRALLSPPKEGETQ